MEKEFTNDLGEILSPTGTEYNRMHAIRIDGKSFNLHFDNASNIDNMESYEPKETSFDTVTIQFFSENAELWEAVFSLRKGITSVSKQVIRIIE